MAKMSDFAVGEKIALNVNGTPYNFIVVHQGNPDTSKYDSSCDGTWLMMEKVYEQRAWDSSNTDYANSDIHAYLNGTFLGMFDSDIQSVIKQVKLPYWNGTGTGGSFASGANGLSTKIFLLSTHELGWTTDTSKNFSVDGACLNYFSGIPDTSNKRIGYYNGTAVTWWLRSPRNLNNYVWHVYTSGGYGSKVCSDSNGVRPVFVIPSDFRVGGSTIKGSVNIGGTYKELVGGHVNIGGTWKEICGSYVNIGGTWKQTF